MRKMQPWLIIGIILIAAVSLQAQLVEQADISNILAFDDSQYGPWYMDQAGNYVVATTGPENSPNRVYKWDTYQFANWEDWMSPGQVGGSPWDGAVSSISGIASTGTVIGTFTYPEYYHNTNGDTIPDTLFNAQIPAAAVNGSPHWGAWVPMGILGDTLAYGSLNFGTAKVISNDGNVIAGTMSIQEEGDWGPTNNNVGFAFSLDSMRLEPLHRLSEGAASSVSAISGDGSVIVGTSNLGWTGYPFIWTRNAEGGYDTTRVDSPIVDMSTSQISENGQHYSGNGAFSFNGQAAYMMTEIDGVDTLVQMPGLPGLLGGPGVRSIANDGTAFGVFQEAGGPWGGPMHAWMWHHEGGAKPVAYAMEALGLETPEPGMAPFNLVQVLAADTSGKKLLLNWQNDNWEARYSWVVLPDVVPPVHLEIAYDGDNHVIPATLEMEWENVMPYNYTYRVEYAYMPYGGTWGEWTELANNYDDDDFDHAISEGGYYKYQVVSLYGADESMATQSEVFEVRRLMDEPAIIAVADVPEDQGGKVIVNFAASGFDILGGMTNELYTIETMIGDDWVAVATTAAYGSNEYSVLVNTINDSMDEGTTNSQDFRVVAALGEDAFMSATASGYSVDNIAPPVPTGLAGEVLDGTGIALTWDAVNINDLGLYEVYRGTNTEMTDGEIIAQTASSEYTDTDIDFANGVTYYYAVAGLDIHENLGEASSSVIMTVVSVDLQAIPTEFAMNQNYPNPFNPSTQINFSLPEASEMTLTVYDLSGRQIVRLVETSMSAGYHQVIWNGMNAQGESVSTGMYIYRMQAGNFSETRKMTYLR